jgi:hypothetical protein
MMGLHKLVALVLSLCLFFSLVLLKTSHEALHGHAYTALLELFFFEGNFLHIGVHEPLSMIDMMNSDNKAVFLQ